MGAFLEAREEKVKKLQGDLLAPRGEEIGGTYITGCKYMVELLSYKSTPQLFQDCYRKL